MSTVALGDLVAQTSASTGEEAVRIIPGILWIVFAAAVVAIFYRPIRYELLPRLSTLKLPGGIELTLKERIDDAAQRQRVTVSEDDKGRIVRRLERLAPLLRAARILWVDDAPENNINEASILAAFGAMIDTARSTSEANEKLKRSHYDLVISDIQREGLTDAGVRFVRERRGVPWTILYAGDYDPAQGTPPFAFAITNRPHQLLHYVLDVLERERA